MRVTTLLKASWLVFAQALQVELSYRFALLQSFVGIFIGVGGLVLFWLAAARAATIQTYTLGALVAYFLFAGAHAVMHENRLSFNLSSSIRMGKLSASMLRPFPFLVTVIMQAAAHAVVRTMILTPIIVALLFNVDVFSGIWIDFSRERLGWYAAALCLSFAAGWLVKVAIGLLAFDMTQTWGPELIYMSLFAVASGSSYPPDLLPDFWQGVVSWTPVYYMVGFPAQVILGKLSAGLLWLLFWRGALVSILTGVLVTLMWRRGVRRFDAVGI